MVGRGVAVTVAGDCGGGVALAVAVASLSLSLSLPTPYCLASCPSTTTIRECNGKTAAMGVQFTNYYGVTE